MLQLHAVYCIGHPSNHLPSIDQNYNIKAQKLVLTEHTCCSFNYINQAGTTGRLSFYSECCCTTYILAYHVTDAHSVVVHRKQFDVLAWITAIQSAGPVSNQVAPVKQLLQIIITDTVVFCPLDGFLAFWLLQQCQQFLWTYWKQIGLEAAFWWFELSCNKFTIQFNSINLQFTAINLQIYNTLYRRH